MRTHVIFAGCITSSLSAVVVARVDLHPVAIAKVPIVGTAGDTPISFNPRPIITNEGFVAFMEAGPHPRIWFGKPGMSISSIKEGTPVLGGTATLSMLGVPQAGINGAIAFQARLAGTGITGENRDALWIWGASERALAARTGEPAPGTDATFGMLLPRFKLGPNGNVGFIADLAGTSVSSENNEGIWLGPPGSLRLVARRGDTAPGTAGLLYTQLQSPVVSASGLSVFTSLLNAPETADEGLWIRLGDTTRLVSREGDIAPFGDHLHSFGPIESPPSVNAAGQFTFSTRIESFPGDRGSGSAVWRGSNDSSLRAIAAPQQPAPGTAALFHSALGWGLGDSGELLFHASLTDSNGTAELGDGLWIDDGTSTHMIVRDGSTVGDNRIEHVEDAALLSSSSHDIVFSASLRDLDGTPGKGRAVFFTNTAGDEPQMILRADELLEVAPGDVRRVSDWGLRGISDMGTALILVEFADRSSGIFTATVPEPELPLVIIGLGISHRLRRNRTI